MIKGKWYDVPNTTKRNTGVGTKSTTITSWTVTPSKTSGTLARARTAEIGPITTEKDDLTTGTKAAT